MREFEQKQSFVPIEDQQPGGRSFR
jgi:hypothetical protein